MGRPKATLPWGNGVLIEHVLGVLRAHCPRVVVVAHQGLELPPLGPAVQRVDDPPERDDQGPLAGVLVGLEQLRGEAELAFVAACDAPFLSPEHVAFMFDRLQHAPNTDASLPCSTATAERPARPHPLGGVLRVGPAHRAATELLARSERALKRLFEALPCDRVPIDALPDPRALQDCNTLEHYRAALAELQP